MNPPKPKYGINPAFPNAICSLSRDFLDEFNNGEYDELLDGVLKGYSLKKIKLIEERRCIEKEMEINRDRLQDLNAEYSELIKARDEGQSAKTN